MFPNLDAEQARHKESNKLVSEMLGISRISYENKKKTGKFTAIQCATLCKHYGVSFDYLFATSKRQDTA